MWMGRIGVISDTHVPVRARTLPGAVFDLFAGVDLILHAGDLITLDVLSELEAIAPVVAVHGNVERPEVLQRLPAERRIELWPNDLVKVDGCVFLAATPSAAVAPQLRPQLQRPHQRQPASVLEPEAQPQPGPEPQLRVLPSPEPPIQPSPSIELPIQPSPSPSPSPEAKLEPLPSPEPQPASQPPLHSARSKPEPRLEPVPLVIGLVHGHEGVGRTTPERAASHFPDAAIVVFGHSHQPLNEWREGRLLFNPGSATDPRRAPSATVGIIAVKDTVTARVIHLSGG